MRELAAQLLLSWTAVLVKLHRKRTGTAVVLAAMTHLSCTNLSVSWVAGPVGTAMVVGWETLQNTTDKLPLDGARRCQL